LKLKILVLFSYIAECVFRKCCQLVFAGTHVVFLVNLLVIAFNSFFAIFPYPISKIRASDKRSCKQCRNRWSTWWSH